MDLVFFACFDLLSAPSDIPNARLVQAKLAELESVRAHKIREGFRGFNATFYPVRVDNLTLMEINRMRTYLGKSMDYLHAMVQATNKAESTNRQVAARGIERDRETTQPEDLPRAVGAENAQVQAVEDSSFTRPKKKSIKRTLRPFRG